MYEKCRPKPSRKSRVFGHAVIDVELYREGNSRGVNFDGNISQDHGLRLRKDVVSVYTLAI